MCGLLATAHGWAAMHRLMWLTTPRTTLQSQQCPTRGVETTFGVSSVRGRWSLCPKSRLTCHPDIDTTNTIMQTWRSNATQGWALGLLSDSNIQPWDSDDVGMEVCWYGSMTSGVSIQAAADTNNASDLAYRLVYSSDETTFQTMTFHGDTQLWEPEQTLPGVDGRSSPACSNFGSGSVDYLMLMDPDNSVNVY